MSKLSGVKVAFLVEDGYEDMECWYPKIRLEEAGAETSVASRERGVLESKHGYPIEAASTAEELDPGSFDAVVIPGGTGSPDKLRRSKPVKDFVKKMDREGKLIAIICHAGWVPISAGVLKGKTATGYEAIKDDLVNAGVEYRDESVVVDGNLISSRHPGDLPDFLKEIIDYLE
ncbi:type 1 glutamine amidotransferase [Candidatus Bipolaricaulota bacterium]|nr:type 1 glutamine amidotransferase [Candidatus Bipolaricaulota bacterium]